MTQVHDMLFLWKLRAWSDIVMLSLTFSLTLFVSVEIGLLVSVIVSILMVIKVRPPLFSAWDVCFLKKVMRW